MIEKINPMFFVRRKEPNLRLEEIARFKERFPKIPEDYPKLLQEASDLQVELVKGSEYVEPGTSENLYIINLYSTIETIDGIMSISTVKHVCGADTDAVAIGTDGGDSIFIYMHGNNGWGLYLLNMTNRETTWVAPTLSDLLIDGTGIEACLKHSYGMM